MRAARSSHPPAQSRSPGGRSAHARPERAGLPGLHALLGRVPGKLSTLCSARSGFLATRSLRLAGRRSEPPLPGPGGGGAAWPPDPEPVKRDTHHVGGVRREGRRPQLCACVEGRPAPAENEASTWAPIGWEWAVRACVLSRMLPGKQGGAGLSMAAA